MNTNLLQADADVVKTGLEIPQSLDGILVDNDDTCISVQTSDAMFKSFENDPDNINISNLYTPQESIDLSDLFNALSPYKSQTNGIPTLDFDDIMKSIDDDIKSRMNEEG